MNTTTDVTTFHKKKFLISLLLFIVLNIFLYSFIFLFHNQLPFHKTNYIKSSHHYLEDARINHGTFELLRALGQYDAQWYLYIAEHGYSHHPKFSTLGNKQSFEAPAYAFFPLYPLLIASINVFTQHIELSAFVLANILLLANFISIYYVIGKLYSENIALKTNFLLFLFPFSIFYRSYFTEGLFLLLLMWFSYFLIKKRLLLCAIICSLLLVTRPNGVIPFMILCGSLGFSYFSHKINLLSVLKLFVVSLIPFITWLLFCLQQTDNAFYWLAIQKIWAGPITPSKAIFQNLGSLLFFPILPLHSFHVSKVDIIVVVLFGVLVLLSKKKIKYEFWLLGLLFWLFPLLMKDTMSYSRYQIISFPIFLYLALITSSIKYSSLLVLFLVGLLFVSLAFVNWFWIG